MSLEDRFNCTLIGVSLEDMFYCIVGVLSLECPMKTGLTVFSEPEADRMGYKLC